MSFSLDPALAGELRDFGRRRGRLVVLTGAGVSAESGIPTFRGKDGYWTVGSRVFHPHEMATLGMFEKRPWDVWQWYLYRLGICSAAAPNDAHRAIATTEAHLGDRFVLITQNVDGLHLRAGNTPERTYQVHGNIALMRCALRCSDELFPVPGGLATTRRDQPVSEADRIRLVCPKCASLARPHVLWFDECYDEILYRYESSMEAARTADALLVVGTSGATTLPSRVADVAFERGILFVDVNPDENPFAEMASSTSRGHSIRGSACDVVPALASALAQECL